MGGWVKWEKDLESDPRVLRMVRELKRLCSAPALQDAACVTHVCGALLRLWSYADSHIRADNTLDLGAREIDDLLGVESFCSLMPAEWLREIDDEHVELPNFQQHNGTEAKKKALTQKRVAAHRERARNSEQQPSVTTALPDQTKTRLDQREEGACRAPLVLHESLPAEEWEQWLAFRRRKRWPVDDVTLSKQLAELARHDTPTQREMINRSINAGWQGIFPPKGDGRRGPSPEDAERDSLRKLVRRRAAIGLPDFREPSPGESAEAYRRAQDAAWNEKQAKPDARVPSTIAELARSKRVAS